jgi:hypothetical protein
MSRGSSLGLLIAYRLSLALALALVAKSLRNRPALGSHLFATGNDDNHKDNTQNPSGHANGLWGHEHSYCTEGNETHNTLSLCLRGLAFDPPAQQGDDLVG